MSWLAFHGVEQVLLHCLVVNLSYHAHTVFVIGGFPSIALVGTGNANALYLVDPALIETQVDNGRQCAGIVKCLVLVRHNLLQVSP